jgi:hypothetical protein
MKHQLHEVIMEMPGSGKARPMYLATGKAFRIRIEPEKHWLQIELVDELGEPAAGEVFRVELADGTVLGEGTLDQNGCAQVHGFVAEKCIITFPMLEAGSWSYAGSSEQPD